MLFLSENTGIEVKIPTLEEETEYVWRTISDIPFFEEHNYQISLPEGKIISQLKEKARQNKLEDIHYDWLKAHMKTNVYKSSDYEKGYNEIKKNEALINKMIREFSELEKEWSFKKFDKYEVKLTLYGPGGSYDPETGSLLIFTTKEGDFKQYKNPANTIIHEVIHIGIEESIVNKYQVSHSLKERIVDKLVLICFSQYLPEYQQQSIGDSRINPYLKNKRGIQSLDKIVEGFQKKHKQ